MRLALLMLVTTGLAAVVVFLLAKPLRDAASLPAAAGPVPSAQPAPPKLTPDSAAVQDPPARADSCSGKDMRLVKQDLESDVGVFYGRLVVTNSGQRMCRVQGYPLVRALQGDQVVLRSHSVPVSVDRAGPVVHLWPLQSASAAYAFTAADRPNCPPSERTQVILPHTTTPVALDDIESKLRPGLRACQYQVQPFTMGPGATWRGGS